MFAVFPILAQLYGATCLTKICRDSNYVEENCDHRQTAMVVALPQSCAGRDSTAATTASESRKSPPRFMRGSL